MGMFGKGFLTQVARSIFFDNATNGFVSDDIQGAIEELKDTVATSASPGFSFGRSGNTPSGTWMNNEEVPSNKAGRFVYINNAVITNVFVGNENISTFDIEVYSHEGDEINLTLLGTVSVIASRGDSFVVNFPVATGTQLALLVATGSAKNIIAGLKLEGTD